MEMYRLIDKCITMQNVSYDPTLVKSRIVKVFIKSKKILTVSVSNSGDKRLKIE